MIIGPLSVTTFGQLGVLKGGRLQQHWALRSETTGGSPFVKADGCWWGHTARAAVRGLKDR